MKPSTIVNGPLEAHAVVFAEDQPEYRQLPAIKFTGPGGLVVTHWHLTWRERLKVLFGSGIFLSLLTVNHPLQPLKLSTNFEDVQ